MEVPRTRHGVVVQHSQPREGAGREAAPGGEGLWHPGEGRALLREQNRCCTAPLQTCTEGEAAGRNGESRSETLVLPADCQDLHTAGRGCCKVLHGSPWDGREIKQMQSTAQGWERQGAALCPPGTSSLGSGRGRESKGRGHERKNSRNGTGHFVSKKQQGSILEALSDPHGLSKGGTQSVSTALHTGIDGTEVRGCRGKECHWRHGHRDRGLWEPDVLETQLNGGGGGMPALEMGRGDHFAGGHTAGRQRFQG